MKMTYLIGVVVALVLIIVAFSIGKHYPSEDIVGQLTEHIRKETIKQYEQRIADLDRQLKTSQAAYIESQKRYDTIIKRLKELRDGKDSIKPPQDSGELITRFNNLGYTPVGK